MTARLPRTPTGNNLLGVVKHCLNIEVGYFGPTFGREFPAPEELVPMEAFADDPQADWYAPGRRDEEEVDPAVSTRLGVRRPDHRAAATRAPGRVPWWQPDRQDVTLQGRVIVHVIYDLSRHAGHADIIRELYDGATGWQRGNSGAPDDYDWPTYVARLTALADRFK